MGVSLFLPFAYVNSGEWEWGHSFGNGDEEEAEPHPEYRAMPKRPKGPARKGDGGADKPAEKPPVRSVSECQCAQTQPLLFNKNPARNDSDNYNDEGKSYANYHSIL